MTDQPAAGGSYIRDPETGALAPEPAPVPTAPEAPAPETPEPKRKGGK